MVHIFIAFEIICHDYIYYIQKLYLKNFKEKIYFIMTL